MQLLTGVSLLAMKFVAAWASTSATSYMMETTTIYADSTCSGPSVNVKVMENDNCSAKACSLRGFGDNTDYFSAVTCYSADSPSYDPMEDLFQGNSFIEGQVYSSANCTDKSYLYRLGLVVGGCEPFTTDYNHSVSVTLGSDGSASLILFNNTECTQPFMTTYALGNETLANHLCYKGISNTGMIQVIAQYFIHQDYDSTSSDGSVKTAAAESNDTITIIGIVGAVVGVVLAVAVLVVRRQKSKKHHQMDDHLAVMERFSGPDIPYLKSGKTEHSSSRTTNQIHTADRAWDDDIIVAARIPRDKVIVEALVSRGGFGEVYKGTYNGQTVAIKMLRAGSRRSIPLVSGFMAEVKMAAVMDHPRIANFIGVAWDSLSDLCSVTEFMDGGDLKGLIEHYAEQNHPEGFDPIKVKIALHVAHALTYLHSLDPPVIHRDLKSKNILLSQELDAKLTDFGISRERGNETMTAGVGTSLWMAPEVMLGNPYGEQADMFSFGVVLSELSTHSAPYSHAKLRSSSNQPMPRTVILQNVAAGKLSVEFSESGPEAMAELGRACVAMDPNERPTAAEALYTLHKVLTLAFRGER